MVQTSGTEIESKREPKFSIYRYGIHFIRLGLSHYKTLFRCIGSLSRIGLSTVDSVLHLHYVSSIRIFKSIFHSQSDNLTNKIFQ